MNLIERLDQACQVCLKSVRAHPVEAARPNEAGNRMEAPLRRALREMGLRPSMPATRSGSLQQTGYPDIQIEFEGKAAYIECKTYSARNALSTNRAFYFSPSDTFKVTRDAFHLLMAFELIEVGATSRGRTYVAVNYKIADLFDLPCNLKLEFNASNLDMYAQARLLSSGTS